MTADVLMDRRTFVVAAIATAAGSMSARAQTPGTPDASKVLDATPQPDNLDAIYASTEMGQQIVLLNGYEEATYREFELADPGFEILLGGLTAVSVYGIAFEDRVSAMFAKDSLEPRLPLYFVEAAANLEDFEFESFDVQAIGVGDLVGVSSGVSVAVKSSSGTIDSISFCGILVQKSRYVQLLMGAGFLGVVSPLVDIAANLSDRWPSDYLTDMLPALGDAPAGMTIVEEVIQIDSSNSQRLMNSNL